MNPILSITDLSVTLGRTPILRDINLSLGPGTLAALVGPNGSGKSTLLATIAGLHASTNGNVSINGCAVEGQTQLARENLGYMVAQDKLPGLLTPRQCLGLFASTRGLSGIPQQSLQQAQHFGLTPWLDTLLSACSLGTRQKVSVLLALIGTPPLVVLDEPINGLDPVSALALKAYLGELTEQGGCSVLMATHDLTLVEKLADHTIVLLEGRVLLNWDRQRMNKERAKHSEGVEVLIARALAGKDESLA